MSENKAPGIRVFVYGTLKQGHGNHDWFLSEAEFLGRHVIRGPYTMHDLGYFPCVVSRPSMDPADHNFIAGEVYRVDSETLDALDVLEGHPDWYKREQINTPWKWAWLYFMPESYAESAPVIESGCWNPTDEEFEWLTALDEGVRNGTEN